MNGSPQTRDEIVVAFVGPALPSGSEFRTSAYSSAGGMFVNNLLRAIALAGLPPSVVLSFLPIPSFPRSRRIFVRPKPAVLDSGLPVQFLPFVNVTPLKQLSVGLATVSAILRWGWRVRKYRKRVVWSFNLSVPPVLFTLFAARVIGAKMLASLNDINEPGHTVPNRWTYRLDYAMHRWAIPKLDGHIVVADQIMKDFARGRPFVRIEGGVASDMRDLGQPGNEVGLRGDGLFRVTVAGGLNKANGVREIVAAFRLLTQAHFRLQILGSGPLEEFVRRAAAEDPRIEFVGLVPFERVMEAYRRSDLLVNMRLTKELSTRYFFPSKLMEYLVSGVPVLTTSTGHVEEEYGPYCIVLRDESPAGLADAIRRVASMTSEARAALAAKARTFMLTHKTWSVQGQRIVSYVREVVFEHTVGECSQQL